jgi:mono/diheme cytochrome c family protein
LGTGRGEGFDMTSALSPLALLIPPPLTIGVIVGLEALIVAALLFLGTGAIRRRSQRFGGMARPVAWLAGILGAVLVLGAVFADTTPASDLANPIPDTVTSATAGQNLYLANCAACHGADARGGGPQAGTTAIRPPSLVSGHLNSHTDGDIFYWISNGLPGGMPAWATTLSETDRWNLVNYLRAINGHGPSAPPVASP